MYNPFEKFSTHSRRALKYAFGAALSGGQRAVRPEHILYGISQQRGSVGAEILNRLKLTGNHFKTLTGSETKPSNRITQVGLTSTSRRLLEKAMLLASISHHRYIGTEHLLYGLIEFAPRDISAFFTREHVNHKVIRDNLATVFKTTASFPDFPKNDMKPETSGKACEECGHVHPENDHDDDASTALEFFEKKVGDILDRLGHITFKLGERKAQDPSAKEIREFIGAAMATKQNLIGTLYLLENFCVMPCY